ncbi:MAG: D-aminoacylase [Gemmatimonadaceae bacterium]|nr:D-aminoacylase [Gemmatimonadaceae bacterium]
MHHLTSRPAASRFGSLAALAALVLSAVLLDGCASVATNTPATRRTDFDVVIENGRIVDGTGNPWMYGDVGIVGDRITAVTPRGALRSAIARQRVDARGHVIAPGFIDIQNHSWDDVLWRDGRVVSMVTQGVTSVILGEATTPAPSNDQIEALEEIGGMAPERAALQRSFRGEHGFGAWLDAIGRHANSVNAGSYLGAATVRAYASGQSSSPATAAQVDTMRVVVRNAMRDGAFGISSALIYPPGSYAGTSELVEMAKAMAPYHGGYITHMRSEDDSLFEAMDEAFRIAREGGVQLDIYHLKASTKRNWVKAPAMVAKIDSARAAGLDVGATMYPYPFSGNNLGECIPDWASENGKLFDNLRDATSRARIIREMADPKGAPLCQGEGPATYMVADLRKPENARYEGKRVSDIATAMEKPWPDAIVDLMLSEGRDPSKINFTMSEDNVRMQIRQPWVVIGTDAGGVDPDSTKNVVHPRSYGSYPRILGRYVREQKLLTLEDAVRKMTGGVAARLGLRDRGLLREGMFADVVVFDDATIMDLATPEKPHQISRGVEQLFVNGVQVLRDGKHTGATPGRVLRRPAGE